MTVQDPRLRHLVDVIETIDSTSRSITRVKLIAGELQPLVGRLLRRAVFEAVEAKVPWSEIGKAMGVNRAAAWRQFYEMEGPMLGRWSRVGGKKPRE